MSEKRLREYIENDKIYQEYKKKHKEPKEYERLCFSIRRDIENVLNVLDEIREYIKENKFIDEVDLIEKMAYGIQEVEVVETDELLQILDKANNE